MKRGNFMRSIMVEYNTSNMSKNMHVHDQFNQFKFRDNSYTSKNIMSHTKVKYITKITSN